VKEGIMANVLVEDVLVETVDRFESLPSTGLIAAMQSIGQQEMNCLRSFRLLIATAAYQLQF
jgi:hypothetical protein